MTEGRLSLSSSNSTGVAEKITAPVSVKSSANRSSRVKSVTRLSVVKRMQQESGPSYRVTQSQSTSPASVRYRTDTGTLDSLALPPSVPEKRNAPFP